MTDSTKITIGDVLRKRNQILESGIPMLEAFRSFLGWLGENEKNLDAEANTFFDQILTNTFKVVGETAAKMPDTPQKREVQRVIAKDTGGHIAVKGMLEAFKRDHKYHDKLIDEWSNIALNIHQSIADFLYDVTVSDNNHQYSIVLVTLLYGCIDELTVAHLLGRHFYFVQANAHLRTVLETLDRVELFVKEPNWVDTWANSDWKTILTELGPSSVRAKLGKDRHDPLYGYLSNNGTHASFESFKSRAFKSGDTEKQARVFVGGTPMVNLQIFHFLFSLIVANLLLTRLVGLFGEKALNFEEVEGRLKKVVKDFEIFNEKHFTPWAVKNGIDVSEISKMFSQFSAEYKE